MEQKNNRGQESNARQQGNAESNCFHWLEVIFYFVLLATVATGIFLYFKYIAIPSMNFESKPLKTPLILMSRPMSKILILIEMTAMVFHLTIKKK